MSATLTRPEPAVPSSLRDLDPHTRRRKRRSGLVRRLLTAAMVVAVVPLILIVAMVVARGWGALGWEFLSTVQPPARRPGGGYLHGIVGTAYMTGLATLLAVPLGILGAVYLVEYGRGWLARVIRFFADVMTGVPSIFVGLFVYAALVRQHGFGTIMGALGLGIMMLPIVVRSSEEMLRLVPADQRAASTALGARTWQTITKVVLPSAAPGLTTGSLLAVARAAGETAVLLVTALGTLQVTTALSGRPQTSISMLIYQGAKQPFEPGKERAWAGACTLMAFVFLLTLAARFITARTRR